MNDDWLSVHEADDDWLDARAPDPDSPYGKIGLPVSVEPKLPATVDIPGDPIDQSVAFNTAWGSLSEQQRVFLNMWRDCDFNERKTVRVLDTTAHSVARTTVRNWHGEPGYKIALELLRTASARDLLNREKILFRQEEAIESMMTPQPILHQGVATGHYEVKAAQAAKANETMMRVAGMLKEEDRNALGAQGPALVIQVLQRDNSVLTITPGVMPELPGPDGT